MATLLEQTRKRARELEEATVKAAELAKEAKRSRHDAQQEINDKIHAIDTELEPFETEYKKEFERSRIEVRKIYDEFSKVNGRIQNLNRQRGDLQDHVSKSFEKGSEVKDLLDELGKSYNQNSEWDHMYFFGYNSPNQNAHHVKDATQKLKARIAQLTKQLEQFEERCMCATSVDNERYKTLMEDKEKREKELEEQKMALLREKQALVTKYGFTVDSYSDIDSITKTRIVKPPRMVELETQRQSLIEIWNTHLAKECPNCKKKLRYGENHEEYSDSISGFGGYSWRCR